MKKNITLFLGFIIILAISLFVFLPTFNLALFGDDWYTLWRYLYFLGPKSSDGYNYLTYLITSYGSQDIVMSLLYNLFGNYSPPYYIISYLLRMVATISLIPIIFFLTKNKFAAFLAALFFSITPIGLETTNWVFNMPVYISIAFFNLFLYFFLLFQENNQIKLLITSLSLFLLAHIASPIRMTGLLTFTIFLEIFFALQGLKKKKQFLIEVGLFILVFMLINLTSGIATSVPKSRVAFFVSGINTVNMGIVIIQHLLSQNRFDFILYPLLTIGEMVIPDTTIIISEGFSLFINLIFLYLIFLSVSFLLFKSSEKLNVNFYRKTIIFGFILNLIVIAVYQISKSTLSIHSIISIIVGGYLLITGINLLLCTRKNGSISTALFISISWIVISFIFTWFRAPETVMPTVHRYLIVSAIGISLLFATIFSLGKNTKYRILLFCLILILIIFHMNASRNFIKEQLIYHGRETSSKIWSTIPSMPQIENSIYPVVIYLENDGTNGPILYTSLGFGLDYHLALIYNIRNSDKIPIMMDDWKNIISAVTDGKSFAPYGRSLKPVPIDHIYAFRLEGSDQLINMTDDARGKLKEIMP